MNKKITYAVIAVVVLGVGYVLWNRMKAKNAQANSDVSLADTQPPTTGQPERGYSAPPQPQKG